MALEIGIWETSGTSDKPELLGETMIPMESAIAHNTDWWPLLLPQYLYNLARSSSLDTLGKNHSFSLSSSMKFPPSPSSPQSSFNLIFASGIVSTLLLL